MKCMRMCAHTALEYVHAGGLCLCVQEKALKTCQVIPDCEPPSARVNASFVPYITQVRGLGPDCIAPGACAQMAGGCMDVVVRGCPRLGLDCVVGMRRLLHAEFVPYSTQVRAVQLGDIGVAMRLVSWCMGAEGRGADGVDLYWGARLSSSCAGMRGASRCMSVDT